MLSRAALAVLAAAIGLTGCSPSASQDAPGSAVARAPLPPSPIRRCVNLGNALEAPTEGLWGQVVRKEDMARIRAAGFDTVRIPIAWSAHAADTPPYTIDPAFMARIREVVQWAEAADLQVIINVHHYNEINDDPATHIPRLVAIWDQISDAWADASPRVIFEFLNEPHSEMTAKKVDEVNAFLLNRLRQRHPDRWMILGGGHWGHWSGLIDTNPPFDPRIITTFHFYDPFAFTHQGAPWATQPAPLGTEWGSSRDMRQIKADFDKAYDFAAARGLPVLVGEFGVYEAVPYSQRAEWTGFVRAVAEERGMSWCHWDFAAGFPVYDMENERWIEPVLEALITPPPQSR